ncbi:prolipoprotein diacylglyceryl transferase [Candidatus Roizmanbacteria bacterium]|nr:prolipoprotein diacylglyceryl transferase [Candidatus Roizmanbacteria bacterium]
MLPTLLQIGFVRISSLYVFSIFAVLVAIFIIWKQAKEKLYPENALFDTIILMIVVGIAGARLGFIILHFNAFSLYLLQWIAFWVFPGFYLFGAMVGIIAVLWFQSRKHRDLKFWELVDFVGFAFWIAAIIWLFGLFLAGSEKGLVSGISGAPHPVTLYKLLTLLVILSPYLAFRSGNQRDDWFHKTPGSVGVTSALLLSTMVVALDFFKERAVWYGLSIDQWIALGVSLLSLSVLYYRWKRSPKRDILSISRRMWKTFLRKRLNLPRAVS